MLSLALGRPGGAPAQALVLGAHADDIEIGCGGTILRLVETYPELAWHWVVLSGIGERGREARASAERFVPRADRRTVVVEEFRDGFFPYAGAAIKDFFERLKATVSPDLVLAPWRGDAHQDHRLVAELTWNTFRDHLILEYEIPKYDGDLGQPNVYVALGRPTCTAKVDAIMAGFPSQRSRRWFDPELFWGLLRLRGMEANAPDGYAEAFYGRKLVI
jgi:LmbE family N-acetylglucosaminyl deacetylase